MVHDADMYQEFFGLSEAPYKILPDPRFLWYSDQHKEAKAKIEYHLSQEMLRFRWTVSGGRNLPFDQEAIAEIYRLTGGIARDICKLANEALVRAVFEKQQVVSKSLITAAAAEVVKTTHRIVMSSQPTAEPKNARLPEMWQAGNRANEKSGLPENKIA